MKCWRWLPEATLAERARTDHVPYQACREQGRVHATAGNVSDVVREDIRALAEQYAIREIAFDRWGATQLSTQLQQDGATMVAMGQGSGSPAVPTRELERLVIEGALIHAGQPVLRWMVSNAAVEQDAAGNRKPSKRKSTGRIDGLVSLCMALGRATVASPGEVPSAYADHGLFASGSAACGCSPRLAPT